MAGCKKKMLEGCKRAGVLFVAQQMFHISSSHHLDTSQATNHNNIALPHQIPNHRFQNLPMALSFLKTSTSRIRPRFSGKTSMIKKKRKMQLQLADITENENNIIGCDDSSLVTVNLTLRFGPYRGLLVHGRSNRT